MFKVNEKLFDKFSDDVWFFVVDKVMSTVSLLFVWQCAFSSWSSLSSIVIVLSCYFWMCLSGCGGAGDVAGKEVDI